MASGWWALRRWVTVMRVVRRRPWASCRWAPARRRARHASRRRVRAGDPRRRGSRVERGIRRGYADGRVGRRRARRVRLRRGTLVARDRRHRLGELGEVQRAARCGGGRRGRGGIFGVCLARAPDFVSARADRADALLARQPRRAGRRSLRSNILLRVEELIVRGVVGVHGEAAAAAGALCVCVGSDT